MDGTLYCLVDPAGNVHIRDDVASHAQAAARLGLAGSECREYRFDLLTRRLIGGPATPSDAAGIMASLDECVGTPERLIRFAEEGSLTKKTLADLLDAESRRSFLDACAAIEKEFTEKCVAAGDPCLATGCSIDHEAGEVCLQPLLEAGSDYHRACAAPWVRMFRNADHRIAAWRN